MLACHPSPQQWRYEDVSHPMSRFNRRLELVTKARESSMAEAARVFKTTRVTVRRWVEHYAAEGLSGLQDHSRAPHHIPHKLPAVAAEQIVARRQSHGAWGARRLKERFDLPGSVTAIHRVLKHADLVGRKKRRWRRRKDLSAIKKTYALFAHCQLDTKDLSDIVAYWPLMKRLGLPRYEHTWRELATGAVFYAYADENTSTHAALFAEYVHAHLRHYGIVLTTVHEQTDNGAEYIGAVRKKVPRSSAFERVLARAGVTHDRIPPRSPYLQGDVETFHRIVEDEFYAVEAYTHPLDFLGKAYAYHLFFNYVRKNRNRDHQAPVEILRARFPQVKEGVLNLPPVRLETLMRRDYQGVSHVPVPAPKGLEGT